MNIKSEVYEVNYTRSAFMVARGDGLTGMASFDAAYPKGYFRDFIWYDVHRNKFYVSYGRALMEMARKGL